MIDDRLNVMDYYANPKRAVIALMLDAMRYRTAHIAHVAWQQACAGRN